MSLAMDRSALIRLQKEIGDIRTREAGEVKKAAEAQKKMASAQASAAKASAGLRSSYLSTADRERRALQSALDNQGRYANQVASKTKDAARLQERIMREEERERKAALAADDKRRRDENTRRRSDDAQQRRIADASAEANRQLQLRVGELEAQALAQIEAAAEAVPPFEPKPASGETETFDVFISHASEDKEEFADAFAARAREAGLRVWYDRFELGWGDSLRQKIDSGLASSYFGVVILSPNFFAKQWTNYELDALLERSLGGAGRLLPIWHRLTKDDVMKYAPSLGGRLALNTSFMSIDEIVAELLKLRDGFKTHITPPNHLETERSPKARAIGPLTAPNLAVLAPEMIPDQAPGPLQFDFAEGTLQLRHSVSVSEVQGTAMVAAARVGTLESGVLTVESLNSSNCDRRLIEVVEDMQRRIVDRQDIIRVGIASLTCDQMIAQYIDELPPVAAARLRGYSTSISLYIAHFPEWQSFVAEAAAAHVEPSDAQTAIEVARSILPELRAEESLVDPEVPRSIELVFEAIREPKVASRRATFAAVRTLENLAKVLFAEFSSHISSINEGVKSGTKKAASVVAVPLLIVVATAAVSLSPVAERVVMATWLNKAATTVLQILK